MLVRVLQQKSLFRPTSAFLAANRVLLSRGLIRTISNISDVPQAKKTLEIKEMAHFRAIKPRDALARRTPQEIASLLAKAVAGDVQAQYEVGLYYLKVHNASPAEAHQGAQYMALSHKNGHLDSPYHLGICNLRGLGIPKDEKQGVKYLQEAANSGHSGAQFALFECYRDGNGVAEDQEEAMRWCKLAADQGNVDSVVTTFEDFVDENKASLSKTVTKYLTAASNADHPAALYVLGRCYAKGYGVKDSDKQALQLWERAADLGEVRAQYVVALHYSDSHSSGDHQTAAMYYQLAAEQGCAYSQNNLGVWYGLGKVVDQNTAEAFRYLELAAAQDNMTANCNLGVMYRDGLGVVPNVYRAEEYLKLAADGGNKRAQVLLGRLYKETPSLAPDKDTAKQYLRLAKANKTEDHQEYFSKHDPLSWWAQIVLFIGIVC